MKKIAVNTVKAFLKDHVRDDKFVVSFNIGDSSFDVTFHTALTINEKSVFIRRVVSGCFDAAMNYRPEYVIPMIRATVIQMCTNIPALTLKNETDSNGVPALDLDGMNDLYVAMDLDNLQNESYQAMLHDIILLCNEAVDWKRESNLANHGTDTALREFLNTLNAKVESLDTDELLKYAGVLADSTKDLDEGGIINGLIKARVEESK